MRFNIFKDKRVDDLEKRVSKLNDNLKDCAEEIKKLKRIIKYAKDEPTCNITVEPSMHGLSWKIYINLYIDHEECRMLVEVRHHNPPSVSLEDFTVDNDIATVLLKEDSHVYKYIINYKSEEIIRSVVV